MSRRPRPKVTRSTLRDASFVMANLRQCDRDEIMCQVPEGTKTHELAYGLNLSDEAWIVELGERNPIALFGVTPMTPAMVSVWAMGTNDMWRAIPVLTKHFKTDIVPRLIEQGYRTMEARSHEVHLQAHRWMVSTGAVQADQPYVYGRDGEKFLTFRWTADLFNDISATTGSPGKCS